MWIGYATQAMKDFGDHIANQSKTEKNCQAIGNHVIMHAWKRRQLDENIETTRRGTERVAGFTGKRDYRKDFS